MGVDEEKQINAKRIAQNLRIIRRVQKRDPLFLRKIFVSHYCNIPYHLLDKEANVLIKEKGMYPSVMVEELYAGAFHMIRNFELAPFAHDTSLEDLVTEKIDKNEL